MGNQLVQVCYSELLAGIQYCSEDLKLQGQDKVLSVQCQDQGQGLRHEGQGQDLGSLKVSFVTSQ